MGARRDASLRFGHPQRAPGDVAARQCDEQRERAQLR
jgi:hypothetical protein